MSEQNSGKIINAGRTTCTCGDGCRCGCGYRTGYHILRWVLGIFIVFFVFALGIKVGEFITEFHYAVGSASYGYHSMMRNPAGFNPGGPMIPAPAPTTTSTTPTVPVE